MSDPGYMADNTDHREVIERAVQHHRDAPDLVAVTARRTGQEERSVSRKSPPANIHPSVRNAPKNHRRADPAQRRRRNVLVFTHL
jgi:hypothetical protein